MVIFVLPRRPVRLNAPLTAFPVSVTQPALGELAGLVARQLRLDHDAARHLEARQPLAQPIDHVGLASDYSIRGIEATHTRESWYVPRLTSFKPVYRVRWPPWIKELDPPQRFRNITHGLARRGYRSADIEKLLGGNWVRYFTEVLG